jgi:hypothetical protein
MKVEKRILEFVITSGLGLALSKMLGFVSRLLLVLWLLLEVEKRTLLVSII